MNQILATDNKNNNQDNDPITDEKDYNNNYNNDDYNNYDNYNNYNDNNGYNNYDLNSLNSYSEKPEKKANIKKIIIIFAICIAVFGIVLIAVFALGMKKDKEEKEKVVEKPKITIEEDGNKAKVIIKSEGGTSKLTYYWDKNSKNEFNLNNVLEYSMSLDIPNGNSELHVIAEDSTGQSTETYEEFYRDIDTKEPIITVEEYGTGQLKIIATDETSMDHVTYKIGEEEEQTVKAENEGDTQIEVIVDAERGKTKMFITAEDTSGNEATDTFNVQGGLKPTIEFKKSKTGKKVKVTISHDKGFKEVKVYFNGEIVTYNEESEDYDEAKTELQYIYNLEEGENTIAVIATSLEWDEKNNEYISKKEVRHTTYNPTESEE